MDNVNDDEPSLLKEQNVSLGVIHSPINYINSTNRADLPFSWYFNHPLRTKFFIGYERQLDKRWSLRASINYNPFSIGEERREYPEEKYNEVKFFQMGYFAVGANFDPIVLENYRLGMAVDLFAQKRRPHHGNYNVWNYGVGIVLLDHEFSLSDRFDLQLEMFGLSWGSKLGILQDPPENLNDKFRFSYYRTMALSVKYSF